jgi:hypothetical protein
MEQLLSEGIHEKDSVSVDSERPAISPTEMIQDEQATQPQEKDFVDAADDTFEFDDGKLFSPEKSFPLGDEINFSSSDEEAVAGVADEEVDDKVFNALTRANRLQNMYADEGDSDSDNEGGSSNRRKKANSDDEEFSLSKKAKATQKKHSKKSSKSDKKSKKHRDADASKGSDSESSASSSSSSSSSGSDNDNEASPAANKSKSKAATATRKVNPTVLPAKPVTVVSTEIEVCFVVSFIK